MENSKKEKDLDTLKTTLPEKYESPKINSEDLMAFAASCNGTTNGGRKSSIGDPDFCRSRRLNS